MMLTENSKEDEAKEKTEGTKEEDQDEAEVNGEAEQQDPDAKCGVKALVLWRTEMFAMNLLPYILGAMLGAIVSVWITILYQGFLNDDEEEDTHYFPEDQLIGPA
ncbi:Hypp3167 [Branchiostoma lanceolatum]|uniref:Hypp3167 protein n=1 Tax=Branchiostoma lanceolatum TaxID=7740 RepID=A0A8J9ZXG8_BRALA|nr:Hypp3167 [Branchiostoma lanceolatum]